MARRRASTRAAAAWVALAAVALLLPRGASAGEGDDEELAALAATKARLEKNTFSAEAGAAPHSHASAAPATHADKKSSRSTPQQRLAIAILTLKSAFVEPNVKSNDAVCNPDDAPDPCHCASREQRGPCDACLPPAARAELLGAARRRSALGATSCLVRPRRPRWAAASRTAARAAYAQLTALRHTQTCSRRTTARAPTSASTVRARGRLRPHLMRRCGSACLHCLTSAQLSCCACTAGPRAQI
jgi:hypothetical protein